VAAADSPSPDPAADPASPIASTPQRRGRGAGGPVAPTGRGAFVCLCLAPPPTVFCPVVRAVTGVCVRRAARYVPLAPTPHAPAHYVCVLAACREGWVVWGPLHRRCGRGVGDGSQAVQPPPPPKPPLNWPRAWKCLVSWAGIAPVPRCRRRLVFPCCCARLSFLAGCARRGGAGGMCAARSA
jgi:hypothetical protein